MPLALDPPSHGNDVKNAVVVSDASVRLTSPRDTPVEGSARNNWSLLAKTGRTGENTRFLKQRST